MQTRDVVLVLLHRIERHGKRQIGQATCGPSIWLTGISNSLKSIVVDALLQRVQQNLVRQRILFGKAGGRNGLQAREEDLIARVFALRPCERVVVQPIVIAIVAVGGGSLRMGLEIGLVLFLEKRILRTDARFNGGGSCRADVHARSSSRRVERRMFQVRMEKD